MIQWLLHFLSIYGPSIIDFWFGEVMFIILKLWASAITDTCFIVIDFLIEINTLVFLAPMKIVLDYRCGSLLIDFVTLFQFDITKKLMDTCFKIHGFIVSLPLNLITWNRTGMYFHMPIISKFNFCDIQNVTFHYVGNHPYEKKYITIISNNILKVEDIEKLLSEIINDFSEKKQRNNKLTGTTTWNMYQHLLYCEAHKILGETGQVKTLSISEQIEYKKNHLINFFNTKENLNSPYNNYPAHKTINVKDFIKVMSDHEYMAKILSSFGIYMYLMTYTAIIGACVAFAIVISNSQSFQYTLNEESVLIPTHLNVTGEFVHILNERHGDLINAILSSF